MRELLTPQQMNLADRSTIDAGTPGIVLMRNAGRAVADIALAHYPAAERVLIVCGTGNNGGDGFVAAQHLADRGVCVDVYIVGERDTVSGDARQALVDLDDGLITEDPADMARYGLIIDALFGAGLGRAVEGEFAAVISGINASGKPVISVDLPSGIDGRTGQIMGTAIEATRTVTFFRFKPGHFLVPGRHRCGELELSQIGIDETVLQSMEGVMQRNTPAGWLSTYPVPGIDTHKYDRGHTLVVSGPVHASGAARLVAGAALRVGSGLVTVASPEDALVVNASHLTSIMLRAFENHDDIVQILDDDRFNCVALGPGLDPDEDTALLVEAILPLGRQVVVDAGGLSAFAGQPERLFKAIDASPGDTIITPHEGEFSRLFPELVAEPSKAVRAKFAAQKSGAIVILKGPDTVIAGPDGRVCISDNAPPWLATAGSGDVLAGMVSGLLAQNMLPFEAACAAVWLHGDAANRIGPGLISSDLDEGLQRAIFELVQRLND